jgi:hypothetical protein
MPANRLEPNAPKDIRNQISVPIFRSLTRHGWRNNSGSFATLAAIRRASSLLSNFPAEWRPSSLADSEKKPQQVSAGASFWVVGSARGSPGFLGLAPVAHPGRSAAARMILVHFGPHLRRSAGPTRRASAACERCGGGYRRWERRELGRADHLLGAIWCWGASMTIPSSTSEQDGCASWP